MTHPFVESTSAAMKKKARADLQAAIDTLNMYSDPHYACLHARQLVMRALAPLDRVLALRSLENDEEESLG